MSDNHALPHQPLARAAATPSARLWLLSGLIIGLATVVALACLRLFFAVPDPLAPWLLIGLAPLVIGFGCGMAPPLAPLAPAVLRGALIITAIAVLILVVYAIVVIGLGDPVQRQDRLLLGLSMASAALVALLVVPVRTRVFAIADRLTANAREAPIEVLNGMQARMSRSVPLDELLLSLAERLKANLGAESVTIYTGAAGELSMAAAVPWLARPPLSLNTSEQTVIARTRSGGNRWVATWLPELATEGANVRVVPLSHQGELLGLIHVRHALDRELSDEEDRVLVEIARQIGLALRNARLDSALQHSLTELEKRNDELRESRMRIVTSSNETRRAIERNLHDGAQQHLVALAVKIGLVEQLLSAGASEKAIEFLSELRGDVQETVREVRELAHGIYPPLLRDKGLAEALRAAATRSALDVSVEVVDVARHSADMEAAIYFCCVEALQNAGKYAGESATVTITVRESSGKLTFAIADDGVGFDADDESVSQGHGFSNISDRLGALGGTFTVTSRPGAGVIVTGTIPTPEQTDIEGKVES